MNVDVLKQYCGASIAVWYAYLQHWYGMIYNVPDIGDTYEVSSSNNYSNISATILQKDLTLAC